MEENILEQKIIKGHKVRCKLFSSGLLCHDIQQFLSLQLWSWLGEQQRVSLFMLTEPVKAPALRPIALSLLNWKVMISADRSLWEGLEAWTMKRTSNRDYVLSVTIERCTCVLLAWLNNQLFLNETEQDAISWCVLDTFTHSYRFLKMHLVFFLSLLFYFFKSPFWVIDTHLHWGCGVVYYIPMTPFLSGDTQHKGFFQHCSSLVWNVADCRF